MEKTSATSSLVAVLGTASRSTRWVRMSSASRSVNSMALRRSSDSSSSMPPSWPPRPPAPKVHPGSAADLLDPEDHRHQLFHWVKSQLTGVSRITSALRKGVENMAKRSGAVLGQALGGDFTEDQHHNGNDDGGERRAQVAVVAHKEQRADGCRCDVDDVVADEDGGEELVVVFRQLQRGGGTAAPFFGPGLQPGLVQG